MSSRSRADRGGRLLTALLFPIALGFAGGCGGERRETPAGEQRRAQLGQVEWAPDPDLSGAPDRSWFTARAERMVAGLPPLSAPHGRARVDLSGILLVEEGEARILFEAELRASGLGVPVKAGLVATGPAADAPAIAPLVDQGLADLGTALASLIALVGGDADRWTRALDSAEPDEQVLATQLLARDRVREAIPAIAELLRDPRAVVAEAAAEALATIADETAVPFLIGSIQRGNLRSEVRVIEALARIGGAEAEAYLEMTAGGHEVAEVRRISEAALRRIRDRKPARDSL